MEKFLPAKSDRLHSHFQRERLCIRGVLHLKIKNPARWREEQEHCVLLFRKKKFSNPTDILMYVLYIVNALSLAAPLLSFFQSHPYWFLSVFIVVSALCLHFPHVAGFLAPFVWVAAWVIPLIFESSAPSWYKSIFPIWFVWIIMFGLVLFFAGWHSIQLYVKYLLLNTQCKTVFKDAMDTLLMFEKDYPLEVDYFIPSLREDIITILREKAEAVNDMIGTFKIHPVACFVILDVLYRRFDKIGYLEPEVWHSKQLVKNCLLVLFRSDVIAEDEYEQRLEEFSEKTRGRF